MAKKQYKRRNQSRGKKGEAGIVSDRWNNLSGHLKMQESDKLKYYGLFATVFFLFVAILASAPKNSGF